MLVNTHVQIHACMSYHTVPYRINLHHITLFLSHHPTSYHISLYVSHDVNLITSHHFPSQAYALVSTSLDEIAWLFNVRGSDVPCNPVSVSYAIVTTGGKERLLGSVHFRACVLLITLFEFMYLKAVLKSPHTKIHQHTHTFLSKNVTGEEILNSKCVCVDVRCFVVVRVQHSSE